MKRKIICVFIALFMAVCIAAGCNNSGEVRDPSDLGGGTVADNGDFTVTLVLDDRPFKPSGRVTATWDDGLSRPVTAEFNSDGVATAAGLDGDYVVTVQGLPARYTFDPNGTVATNNNRKIEFEIYEVHVLPEFTPPTSGDILFGAVRLSEQGAYRLTITNPLETYYCYFQPGRSGMYSVKSLIDIKENAINPKYQICSGTLNGARYQGAVVDGGGASGTYTVNFDYRTGFNFDEIGTSTILLFGVSAQTRTLEYPLTFDILVKRTGSYVRQDIVSDAALPTEFDRVLPDSQYNGQEGYISESDFRAQQDAFMRGTANNSTQVMFYTSRVLNGDLVRFNEETGYYHLYDSQTGEYGAVIWAKITENFAYMGEPFSGVEYVGNKALTIDDNFDKFYKKTPPKYGADKDPHYINYKVFIEGYRNIISHENDFPGITEQFAAYEGVYGYADFCNQDGVYPVNKELQRFLQGYATNQRLFMDGNGWAETDDRNRLTSAEEDQWMFACGYYA